MNNDDAHYDETESAGGSMIQLNFREWIMTPQFAYLNGAPTGETEACDTLSPEGGALERRALEGRSAKRFIKTAFASFDEFKKIAPKDLLFFHVFEGNPNAAVLRLLSDCQENERTRLLDVGNDLGFLKNTSIDLSGPPERRPVSKPLAELRGLGAWTRGTMFGFEENEAAIASFISKARAFAHAGQ